MNHITNLFLLVAILSLIHSKSSKTSNEDCKSIIEYCGKCSTEEPTKCSECSEGYTLNEQTGNCNKVDCLTGPTKVPYCRDCDEVNETVCIRCALAYHLDSNKQCVPGDATHGEYRVKYCTFGDKEDTLKCEECYKGYHL